MTIIDLPLAERESVSYRDVVRAEIIDIAPHLAHIATFAIHRALKDDECFGAWSVTNIETGANVGRADTRSECIARATRNCADKTPAMVKRAYRRFAP